MQFTGLKDSKGVDIYEGDVLQFSDKAEWYKSEFLSKEEIEQRPYERRVVQMIECYEWMLSDEIQCYWEVIGNIYENPNLLEDIKGAA